MASRRVLKIRDFICALAVFGMTSAANGYIATFDDLPLAAESYWNGSDGSGGFSSGAAQFNNNYDATWGFWDGFSYSNITDTLAEGMAGQFNAITGTGQGGSANYGVSYVGWAGPSTITLNAAGIVEGLYVTNNNSAYYSMLNGDSFAKKFGGVTGDDEDWFVLTITGKDAGGAVTEVVEFYLADYRFADNGEDYIVDAWEYVDLSELGVVKSLEFGLISSDVGPWGMNTPAYFAIDTLGEVGGVGDLTVTSVSTEATGVAGKAVHVEWDVFNDYTEEKIGPGFLDAVYLSSDKEWDINDIILAIIQHNESVEPQTGYHAETDVILPGVLPGRYYLLVRTDFGNRVYEPDGEDNNIASTDANMEVDVQELIIGTPADSNFVHPELSRYFRVTVPAGEDVEIRLDDLDDAGSNELYASFGRIPTRSQFGYRHDLDFLPDQTVYIPDTQSGTYYILAYGSNLAGSSVGDFTIGVQYLPLEITEISPASGGNAGTVTATIQGARFKSSTTTKLIGPDGTTIAGELHKLSSTMEMIVTFDLEDADEGFYDVQVENNDGESFLLEDAFEVFGGRGPRLEARLIVPSQVRAASKATLWLEYSNTGDADMLPPLFKVSNSSNAQMSLSRDQGFQDKPLQLLGISGAEPLDVLIPGASNRLPVYSLAPVTTGTVDFSLGVLTADSLEPIDWVQFESEVRPPDAEPNEWDIVFTRLQGQIGPTWGDYISVLVDNLRTRALYGMATYDVRTLFDDELRKAYSEKRCTIGGHVYLAESGADLANVEVSISQIDGNDFSVTTTDSEGRFMAQFVRPGDYEVEVQGYVMDGPVQVRTIEEQDAIPIELAVNLGGKITGIVTGHGCSPLHGVYVVAVADSDEGTYLTSTDEDGYYEISGLREGHYTIRCDFETYLSAEQKDIPVLGGSVTPNVNFVLEEGGKLTGCVRSSADNQPLERAEVTLELANGDVRISSTDSSGVYLLDGIPSGSWLVSFDHPTHLPSDSEVVTVTEGVTTTKDMILDRGVRVVGHITDASTGDNVANASVYVFADGVLAWSGESDANGLATIEGLAPNTYTVVVDFSGRARAWYTPLDVVSGPEEFSISLHPESSIAGSITLDGDPLLTANVLAVRDSNLPFSVFAGESHDGAFVFSGLPSGRYYLQIFDEQIVTTVEDVVLDFGEDLDMGTIVLDTSSSGLALVSAGISATGERRSTTLGFPFSLPCPSFFGKYCKLIQNVERKLNDPSDYDLPLWPDGCSDCSSLYWQAHDHIGFIDDRFDHWDTTRRSLRGVVFRDGTIAFLYGVSTACDIAMGIYGDVLKKRNLIYTDLAEYADLIEAVKHCTDHAMLVGALLKDLILCLRGNCDTSEILLDLTQELIFLGDFILEVEGFEDLAPGPIGSIISVLRDIYNFGTTCQAISHELKDLWDLDEVARLDYENQVMRAIAAIHKYQNCLRYCGTDADDDDHDGVPNDRDRCPGTPSSESVDEVGCSENQRDPTPPDPPTPPNGGGTTSVLRSWDPNKKIGPAGSGGSGLVLPGQLMVYTVHFENEPNASAAALEVRIEDQLDEDLDWTSFELLEIGFGDYAVTIPDGMSHYETRLDVNGWTWSEEDDWHTGETPLMADISVDIDISTGKATWHMTSYDPNTGWGPEDAYAGFLPPDDANDITHRGEGYVSFAVRPKVDSPAGTLITNSARIFFDENPPIETPATSNIVTIDLADLDLSGEIDFGDIARLAEEWLWVGLAGTVDEDIVVDGSVNFLDYGKVAEKWLSP